ncbi:MAG: hypothetical protein J0M18_00525 [Ignavibacteria bacterium]|nr:hypothetical protein [Ignavibacteria bacterium]
MINKLFVILSLILIVYSLANAQRNYNYSGFNSDSLNLYTIVKIQTNFFESYNLITITDENSKIYYLLTEKKFDKDYFQRLKEDQSYLLRLEKIDSNFYASRLNPRFNSGMVFFDDTLFYSDGYIKIPVYTSKNVVDLYYKE